MARRNVEWTEKDCNTFKELCAIFCTQEEICRVMDIEKKTLKKLINEHLLEEVTGQHTKKIGFQEAFDFYSADGKMSLRRKQFDMALNGDRTMLVFLGKVYLHQNDKPEAAGSSTPKKSGKQTSSDGGQVTSFSSFKGKSPVSNSKAVGR